MITQIRSRKDYEAVMKTIEGLIAVATKKGGFHRMTQSDARMLSRLSRLAERYEDAVMRVMPVRPRTIQEAVEFKRLERKLTRAKLARKLGIGAPKLSQIMSGKRAPDVAFLKAVHKELGIDAEFLLRSA